MLAALKEKIKLFPDLPGVYLLKDESGRIIYVGKALSLRQRVRSYLVDDAAHSPRLQLLQAKMKDADYIVTDSEVEALILECNLIKEYRPRFNVNLKDDKDYPYLMITAEHFPRLELLRLSQREDRKVRCRTLPEKSERRFGPYTDVGAVRETMRLLGSIFPLRRCRQPLDGTPAAERPCLNFQMKKCLAPCRGEAEVSHSRYNGMVRQVELFLKGSYNDLEMMLKKQMLLAAQEQRFEEAALLRDRIEALQRVAGQRQKVLSAEDRTNRDVLALVRLEQRTAVHLFKIRDGKLLNQEHFPLSGAGEVSDDEVMASFIKSYYNRADSPPDEVIVSTQPAESELLIRWFREIAGRKIKICFPRRGSLKKLSDLACRNGLLKLQEDQDRLERMISEPLRELGMLLGLPKAPERIEGYDISHLHGSEALGAMVVFKQGEPLKAGYRRFNIHQAKAGDDYAALQEVFMRRAKNEKWPRPDLIMIDGGRGQLNAVRVTLRATAMNDIPLVALAKNPDRLFIEGPDLPVLPAADNAMLMLLQRIRDEAHRFAVSGHRLKRSRRAVRSLLELIPGVGPARRKALLEHFGSTEKVRQASLSDLEEVEGINASLAVVIRQYLGGNNQAG